VEYIWQGIAEEFNPTFNEDLVNHETNTDMNIGDESFHSDENFFPIPDKTEIKIGTVLDVPFSHYNFQRKFSAEYFMIKLGNICEAANVPHHLVDDIVNVLRECDEKDIQFKPENLDLRQHFLCHLEDRFKSPLPLSIVTSLEGFSTNDIEYSHGYCDIVEIIC